MTIPGSGGLQIKTSLHMDDVTVFCLDLLSVCRLMSICDQFELASGAKNRLPEGAGNTVRRGQAVHKILGEHIARVKQKLVIWKHHSLSFVVIQAIFHFIRRSKMDYVYRDTTYKALNKG
eukprot:g26727.t1